MIHLQTSSYPFLAVAQNNAIPYSDVLAIADELDKHGWRWAIDNLSFSGVPTWKLQAAMAWHREYTRRLVMLQREGDDCAEPE